MLAIEAARVASAQGQLPPEVMDALHGGVQATRTPYPVSTAPSALRAGAGGGVFLLPPDELIALAQSQVTRSFTDEECRAAGLTTCQDPREPVASGLTITGGVEAYAGRPSEQPLAGRERQDRGGAEWHCRDASQLRTVHRANRNRSRRQSQTRRRESPGRRRPRRRHPPTRSAGHDAGHRAGQRHGSHTVPRPRRTRENAEPLPDQPALAQPRPILAVDVWPGLRAVGGPRREITRLVQHRSRRPPRPESARDLGRTDDDQRSDRRKRTHPMVHLRRVRQLQRLASHRHHRVRPTPFRGARVLRRLVLPRDRLRPPSGRRRSATSRRARLHTRVSRSQPGRSCPDAIPGGTARIGTGT